MDVIFFFNIMVFVNKLNFYKENFFRMGYLRRKRNLFSFDVDVKVFTIFIYNDLEKIIFSVDGVGFMKSVVNFFE